MRLKVLGTTVSVLVDCLTSPALAEDSTPSQDTKSGSTNAAPETPPAPPPSSDVATPPAAAPVLPADTPPVPPAEPPRETSPAQDPGQPSPVVAGSDTAEVTTDTGTSSVGGKPSPLVLSVAAGYAVASVKYPGLVSRNLDGPFLEISGGIELDPRFRISIAFSNFETKMRRTRTGEWEEGDYKPRVATAGLQSAAGPTEPFVSAAGGVNLQRTFLAHALGPRFDFLPLGSQGPYLGLTTALAITQGIETRVGADLGARVGGEWRPFTQLSVGIEAGAHGQLYGDGNAAIPYATARLNLLLDTLAPSSAWRGRGPGGPSAPRTLPTPPQR